MVRFGSVRRIHLSVESLESSLVSPRACFPRVPALDFARRPAQKQFQVLSNPNNFYALWRTRNSLATALRDSPDAPPEKLLQSIWQHQRLRRDQLTTLDVQRVRVLHPGFGSVEGGPDFREAVIQFGNNAPISGDIEVDIRDSGWRAHGHDKNPAFKNVILHVVWDAKPPASHPPTLCLSKVLDAPLAELSLQLEHNSIRALPETLLGKCSSPLRERDVATQCAEEYSRRNHRARATSYPRCGAHNRLRRIGCGSTRQATIRSGLGVVIES